MNSTPSVPSTVYHCTRIVQLQETFERVLTVEIYKFFLLHAAPFQSVVRTDVIHLILANVHGSDRLRTRMAKETSVSPNVALSTSSKCFLLSHLTAAHAEGLALDVVVCVTTNSVSTPRLFSHLFHHLRRNGTLLLHQLVTR